MNPDALPLERTGCLAQQIGGPHGLPERIRTTTSLREALTAEREWLAELI
jgi:hypothetical protein